MQHGQDNIFCRMIQKGKSYVLITLLLLVSSQTANAVNLAGLMGMPEFVGLAVAIGNVNRAMRDAAENPMDKWRRQNVRSAISALPAAIIGLANVFQAGKLHDKDLPYVQGILGGYVDVNAADNYKKFLKDPKPEYIPQVGDKFPASYLSGPSSTTVASLPSKSPVGTSSSSYDAVSNNKKISYDDSASKNMASENASANAKTQAVAQSQKQNDEKIDSLRITFDDDANKGAADESGSSEDKDQKTLDSNSSALVEGTSGSKSSSSQKTAKQHSHIHKSLQSKKKQKLITIIKKSDEALPVGLDEDFFSTITITDSKDKKKKKLEASKGQDKLSY